MMNGMMICDIHAAVAAAAAALELAPDRTGLDWTKEPHEWARYQFISIHLFSAASS